MSNFRVEKDMLGEREVPAEAYWGIHTQRAMKNFAVSAFRVPAEMITALAEVKEACALANMRAGLLDAKIGEAIAGAAQEVAAGALADQFVVDAFQGGAGTSTNMNMNEVLANRAIEVLGGRKGDYGIVHPLDHVNLSQSTNDVYPTALKVAAIRLVITLSENIARLQGSFQNKEKEFAGILKLGRTEMRDAVPILLGQEFGAYAEAFARDRWRLFKVEERLRQVNLGGTAVGTGLNARREYIAYAIEELQNITGLGIARAENMIDITQNADVFAEVSALVKAAAVNLAKISADLRLLSMGPRGGLAEIRLPVLQEGSSIMPDKANPVISEMASTVAYQVMSLDHAVTLAASSGQLELNAFMPLIAFDLLTELKIMINAVSLFRTELVDGITADEKRCRQWLEESLCLATALSPYIGREMASEISKTACAEGKTIGQAAIEKGCFTPEEIGEIFKSRELTRPGIAGSKKIKRQEEEK
ncbi:MAG: AspA [Deltaproteobacteria bacterium]|nr:AspA [Deltaproteobacteria bacterium]